MPVSTNNMKSLVYRTKRAANIMTLVFIAFLTYVISQWQRVMAIDNFINLMMLTIIMIVNIRFYNIYLNISDLISSEAGAKVSYGKESAEYYKLLRISLWIAIAFFISKIL